MEIIQEVNDMLDYGPRYHYHDFGSLYGSPIFVEEIRYPKYAPYTDSAYYDPKKKRDMSWKNHSSKNLKK